MPLPKILENNIGHFCESLKQFLTKSFSWEFKYYWAGKSLSFPTRGGKFHIPFLEFSFKDHSSDYLSFLYIFWKLVIGWIIKRPISLYLSKSWWAVPSEGFVLSFEQNHSISFYASCYSNIFLSWLHRRMVYLCINNSYWRIYSLSILKILNLILETSQSIRKP